MSHSPHLLGLPLAGLLVFSPCAGASGHLLPDAQGRRAAHEAQGIAVDLGYTSEDARNLSGGDRHTGTHAGQLAIGVRLDLERLWGWDGMQAQASVSLRDGDNLNTRANLGQLLQSQETYGRGSIWRLGSLWLGKKWADGRIGVKAGRMAVGDDFNSLDCMAMDLTFCGSQPAMFAGDYWFNGPASQWAAVLEVKPRSNHYLRVGAYQINPSYANEHGGGLRLAPSGTVGTLTPVEFGWDPELNGFSGHYALGGWYSSAPRADAWRDETGTAWSDSGLPALMRSGAYGGYASLHQQLTHGNGGDPQSGLRVMLDLTRTDRRTGAIDGTTHVILRYTGIGSTRLHDQVGIGIGATEVNPRYGRGLENSTHSAHTEYTAEAFYTLQAMPGVVLQPVLQYVVHPGGRSDNHDAMVIGMKTQLSF